LCGFFFCLESASKCRFPETWRWWRWWC